MLAAVANCPLFRGLFTIHGHSDEASVVDKIPSMRGIEWITPARSISAPEDWFSALVTPQPE